MNEVYVVVNCVAYMIISLWSIWYVLTQDGVEILGRTAHAVISITSFSIAMSPSSMDHSAMSTTFVVAIAVLSIRSFVLRCGILKKLECLLK